MVEGRGQSVFHGGCFDFLHFSVVFDWVFHHDSFGKSGLVDVSILNRQLQTKSETYLIFRFLSGHTLLKRLKFLKILYILRYICMMVKKKSSKLSVYHLSCLSSEESTIFSWQYSVYAKDEKIISFNLWFPFS